MRRGLLLSLLAVGALASPLLAGCFAPGDNAWALRATQLDQMRAVGATGSGVRVAILDTGIDVGHPALRHLRNGRSGDGELVAYRDFVQGTTRPSDHGGHGTFIAGVLAAHEANPGMLASVLGGSDLEGLVPDVQLLVARVCDGEACQPGDVQAGLEWAVDQDADVIGLSLGFGPYAFQPGTVERKNMEEVLSKAEAHGILVVAAAGNGGAVRYPASEPTVLAVGAVDRDGRPRASTAMGGASKPDLAAPGQAIVGPTDGGGVAARHGTSAAVPFVVAAAALLMQRHGDPMDAAGVRLLRSALVETAAPIGVYPAGPYATHDPRVGSGVLQAAEADRRYADLLQAGEVPVEWAWGDWSAPGRGRDGDADATASINLPTLG